jgi:uncharacterized lipoprotein
MRKSFSVFTAVLLVAALGACSALRKVTGQYEKVAAQNEAGRLISPGAPSEGIPPAPSLDSETQVSLATNKVPDIGRAAKSLPGGLGGDTANENHIGEAVPPR